MPISEGVGEYATGVYSDDVLYEYTILLDPLSRGG